MDVVSGERETGRNISISINVETLGGGRIGKGEPKR